MYVCMYVCIYTHKTIKYNLDLKSIYKIIKILHKHKNNMPWIALKIIKNNNVYLKNSKQVGLRWAQEAFKNNNVYLKIVK
jgi:hypothetical protein